MSDPTWVTAASTTSVAVAVDPAWTSGFVGVKTAVRAYDPAARPLSMKDAVPDPSTAACRASPAPVSCTVPPVAGTTVTSTVAVPPAGMLAGAVIVVVVGAALANSTRRRASWVRSFIAVWLATV